MTEHLFDRADTTELDTYAAPRRSFYGKAAIKRVTDGYDVFLTFPARITRELYSYGVNVASAAIEQYYEHSYYDDKRVKVTTYLGFTLWDIDRNATATTRRHIRAFAQMIEDEATNSALWYDAPNPIVVVRYVHDNEAQKLTNVNEDYNCFRGGQLTELVEKALHAVPQARAY